MMLMVKDVKNAGTTEDDPPISKSDNLYKEVSGERARAMVICSSILSKLDLTWSGIEDELNRRDGGDWGEPGDMVDLQFLKSTEHGAI